MNAPPDDTERIRRLLGTDRMSPSAFRTALTTIPATERDVWLDRVFGIEELPDDGPELPRGCVPYLPSSVDTLLKTADLAKVQASDVFVDVGAGLGRAALFMHFLTGAVAIGLEIQTPLVVAARRLAARMNAPRIELLQGDAAELAGTITSGSVFFLYCPFGGERLDKVLYGLEAIARTQEIRVCTVDLPLRALPWLAPVAHVGGLVVHRSHS